MNPLLSAIVLAGGQSSRMGQDKALILVNGIPLLQQTCEIALKCAISVTVVSFYPEKYRVIVPLNCHRLQEQPLPGETISHGPLAGFAQGLATVKTPWVLLLACDLPYLQVNILQQWMQQLPEEDDYLALLPCTDIGWDPLCGFYRTTCLAHLIPFLEHGGRSFQGWLAQISVKSIAFSPIPNIALLEQKMLFNCNTPEDLAQLKLAQLPTPNP